MKKLLLNISMLLILANANAQLLQKVIFFPGFNNQRDFNFDANGILKDIRKPDGTLVQDFIYDANQNLTSTTFYGSSVSTDVFTYDANNRINSLNGQIVYYDEASNTYTTDPDLTDDDQLFMYWEMNDDMLLRNEWFKYLDEIVYTMQGLALNYIDQNQRDCIIDNLGERHMEYVEVPNPMRQACLPACRALALIGYGNIGKKLADGTFISKDLPVSLNYAVESPESEKYIYELNSNGLPYKRTTNYFYLEELNFTYLNMIYYYQGDVIP